MSTFDFDPTESRLRGCTGNKWSRYGPNVLPAWVADMDFDPAPPVRDALIAAVDRGDLGYYGDRLGEVILTFAAWQERKHGWEPDPERCLVVDDVIVALRGCLSAYCAPGDRVIVQPPVYPPILGSVADGPAVLTANPLVYREGNWHLDLHQLAKLAADARMLVLCNPQNPTGRVFREDELRAIARIAVDNDLVVVADEVWGDLTYEPHRHIPIATLGEQIAARTVTLSGPTKTFNLGGLRIAVVSFGSDDLHRRFLDVAGRYLGSSNTLAVEAALAAWRHGDAWLRALKSHLASNRDRVALVLRDELDHLDHAPPEATYLAWIGCRSMSLDRTPAEHLLVNHNLAISPGGDFSPTTPEWVRLNFATGPKLLDSLLDQLVEGLGYR